jgi:hypothetical protein
MRQDLAYDIYDILTCIGKDMHATKKKKPVFISYQAHLRVRTLHYEPGLFFYRLKTILGICKPVLKK